MASGLALSWTEFGASSAESARIWCLPCPAKYFTAHIVESPSPDQVSPRQVGRSHRGHTKPEAAPDDKSDARAHPFVVAGQHASNKNAWLRRQLGETAAPCEH